MSAAKQNNSGGSLGVILIDSDEVTRTSARKFFTAQGLRVSAVADDLASAFHLIRGLRPHLILLELPDHPDEVMEGIRRLRSDYPNLGIIVTGRDASSQVILRAIRSGAQEYLMRPLDMRELGEAVNRISAQVSGGTRGAYRGGSVVAVTSNKGGVGVTSVATNLALAFADRDEAHVALVDLKPHLGDVGVMLDLHPEYNLADAVNGPPLDESRLRGILNVHEASGLSVLTGPEDPEIAETITAVQLVEVFSLLKGMFDHVVVDAGNTIDARILEVLDFADSVLCVAELNVPTVRNVTRGLALYQNLGIPRGKLHLLVNRFQKKTKVGVEDLERATEFPVFWEIPNDYKVMGPALDAGVPALLASPKSKISKSFTALADELDRLPGYRETEAEVREA